VKYIDEYRDPKQAAQLAEAVAKTAGRLGAAPLRFMEVCGTHTRAIFKFGIRQILPRTVDLISGPGCPVCVTATGQIDRAVDLSLRPGVRLATFGDMLRVPGSSLSLAQAQAQGGQVSVVYSTFEALELARRNPKQKVVFLGIGFETTAPTVAAAVAQASQEGLENFSVLSCHKLLPPALKALLSGGQTRISGFLMPGHVTTIIGARAYQPLAEAHQVPCVVSGFELTDILTAILMLLKEVEAGSHQVLIQYTRGVAWEGNCQALALVDRIFEPADSLWRGLGQIPESGLKIRPDYARFDAALCFDLDPSQELVVKDPPGCRCGQVLQGLVEPPKCPLFGRTCSPANPVGPCMVSSEGTCAAHYTYRWSQTRKKSP